jgi:sterol desaturase/sphingolipid hydroxylase (fatty acid hydroxylase superfamily)
MDETFAGSPAIIRMPCMLFSGISYLCGMDIPHIPDLILYAIPLFVVTVVAEGIVLAKKHPDGYHLKDALASISMGLGNVGIGFISKLLVAFVITLLYENFRLTTLPFAWWTWLLLLVADDFCYYWTHRIGHESRLFWASHIVHHSSQRYNLSTALRQTWTGGFFTFIFYLGLPLLGFHPVMIFTQMAISLLYQYWIHTELIDKMPRWFEAVFNTPSHHRVHHGSNPLYLDRNYGGIFIVWDKLFGTFQPELAEEKVRYGLTTNIQTYNPIYIAFHEWIGLGKDIAQSGTGVQDKINYIFRAPGWRHDGTGITSDLMRENWLDKSNYK